MSVSGNDSTTDDKADWHNFAEPHQGNPNLEHETLYAMPSALIDVIARTLPKFWDSAELSFERDLAKATLGGFFSHRRFRHVVVAPIAPDAAIVERYKDAREELGRRGLHHQIRYLDQEYERQQGQEMDSAMAYMEWLLTNPEFLAERDCLRPTLQARVAEFGNFPSHRIGLNHTEPSDRSVLLFLNFLAKWGLETLVTWDLPIPLRPLPLTLMEHQHMLEQSGLTLFLPWHLLGDKRLILSTFVARQRAIGNTRHVEGWLQRKGKSVGPKRLKNLLILRRCLKWALGYRYAERSARHVEKLDLAIAEYLNLSQDSIRKLRSQLDLRQAKICQ